MEDPLKGSPALALTPPQHRTEFLKLFRQTARHRHRYDVFRDFVTLAACTLHNGIFNSFSIEAWPKIAQEREDEYLKIIRSYDKQDQEAFPLLFAHLVGMLDPEPRDILGPLYMELEVASKDQGQFFTPPELSELMARLSYGPELANLQKPFVTVSEPACGAGGMILAFVKVMIEHKLDPSQRMWTQCVDVDRLAALMCYVQLSLWHVPGEVIVGNSLSWELREVWYTPAHTLGLWNIRLKRQASEAEHSLQIQEEEEANGFDPASPPPEPRPLPASEVKPVQLGFDF